MKKYLKIDELAEERGYNVHSLHIASGLAYNSVHSLWRNKSMRADFETLEKMARALNVSIGDLFYDMGEIKEWQRRGERQGVNDADEPC